MGDIKDATDNAWRDWTIPNTPSSGEHEPVKSEIRAAMTLIDTKVETIEAGNGSGFLTYPTLTAMNADTAQADGTTAQNLEDDNLYYWNDGGSAWTLIGPSPAAALVAVQADVAALEAADTALDGRLDTAETDIDTLQAADVSLDGRLDVLEALNAGSRLTALEGADTALDGRLDVIEAANTAMDGRVDTLEAVGAGLRLTALEAASADVAAARAELLSEPAVSELASLWSAVTTGEPSVREAISGSGIIVSSAHGTVIRVNGAAVRAPRAAYRLLPGHKYEVIAAARRMTDTADPLGDAVSLRVAWLRGDKTVIETESLEVINLTVAGGLHLYRSVIALSAGDEVDVVAPAATVYVTPMVETYGSDGVTIILPLLRVTDLTSNTLVSADIAGLSARVAAVESVNPRRAYEAADFVAEPGILYDVDTTDGPVTATLAPTAAEGDRYGFNDYAGTWSTHNLAVDPNGAEFEDAGDGSDPTEPLTCADPVTFTLTFAAGKYRARG